MKRFVPREKLGKKAQKQLDSEQRATWAFSPVTKKVESKKLYDRKRKTHDRYDDYGMGFFFTSLLLCKLSLIYLAFLIIPHSRIAQTWFILCGHYSTFFHRFHLQAYYIS